MFYHTKHATWTGFDDSSSEPGFWWFGTKRLFAKSIIFGSWDHGFRWVLEISWNLIVRSWRVYPSRVARGCFYPRKRTFQRRLKKFEPHFSCFPTLSGRFGVVEISRCGHIQQNDQNWWKSSILMDFAEYDHIWRPRRHRTDQITWKNMKN